MHNDVKLSPAMLRDFVRLRFNDSLGVLERRMQVKADLRLLCYDQASVSDTFIIRQLA